ncbi:MAG: hypothetical protein HY721_28790 [Planctomycetes bacterium]|nr:hypothetical protein [Planctomycetota bacterium]
MSRPVALALPRAPGAAAAALAALLTAFGAFGAFAALAAPAPARAADLLSQGNRLFKEGKLEEAAKVYESEEDDADMLTRRFNAGVSWAKARAAEKAAQRFEEVSAKADGDLRASALYNAGCATFEKAKGLAAQAQKVEGDEEKTKGLAEAAKAYHAAVGFFRSVDPPDPDTVHNIAVAKTALRAVLDQIKRLEEEKRKRAEEDALKSPPELLRALAAKERLHRGLARVLAKEPAKSVRLGSRRLRKAEAENRGLAEKLHHHLAQAAAPPQAPPPAAGAPPQPPQPRGGPSGSSEEEKARNARAAEALSRAIEAMKEAEVACSKLDPAGAVPGHTKAVAELRSAIEALPIDLPGVIQEAIAGQEALNGAMDSLARAERGGIAPEKPGDTAKDGAAGGSSLGKKIVDAVKDKVLLPLAKLLSPAQTEDAKALADDEDDVVWSSRILSQAEIQAPEAAQTPGAPVLPPPPGGQGPHPPEPQLTPEKAKELSEGLQREGTAALEASTKAKDELAAGRAASALPEGEAALEALKRAADLLPKPPEPPEVRLRKLIERQRAAREATGGLAGLEEEARKQAAAELAKGQRPDGKEAGSIAAELEGGPDEPAKAAAPKVREGEAQVYSSAEALDRSLAEEARGAVDRGVKAFEEALAILEGKDKKQDQQEDPEKQQDQQDSQKKDKKKPQPRPDQDKPYALTPRDARAKREEMDRKRREEEAKIFAAPSGLTVEKDW